MIGMGVGYKGNPLSAVGIQPQFRLWKEDAAFDELIRDRGFQGRIGVAGQDSGNGGGSKPIRLPARVRQAIGIFTDS
jgi:hypothetical protein